jgi:putative DNA methylase
MPGIGPHPKGIRHWWARLPLPTARAVLIALIVDEPETHPEKWPSDKSMVRLMKRAAPRWYAAFEEAIKR